MNLRTMVQAVFIGTKRCTVRIVVGIAVALFLYVPGGLTQQQLDSEAVINHLNAVIKLYRNASAELQTGGAPTAAIYTGHDKKLTAGGVGGAFQAARAAAAAIRATEKAGAPYPSSAQSSGQTES